MAAPVLLAVVLLAQGSREASAAPRDDYLYLTSKFDTDGFAKTNRPGEGNFNGQGEIILVNGLPEGRTVTVRSARFGPVVFLRPGTEGDKKNMVAC